MTNRDGLGQHIIHGCAWENNKPRSYTAHHVPFMRSRFGGGPIWEAHGFHVRKTCIQGSLEHTCLQRSWKPLTYLQTFCISFRTQSQRQKMVWKPRESRDLGKERSRMWVVKASILERASVVWIPAHPLTDCMTLAKLLDLPVSTSVK